MNDGVNSPDDIVPQLIGDRTAEILRKLIIRAIREFFWKPLKGKYEVYLKSPRWQMLRLQALRRYLREENIGEFYADFVFGLLVIEVNGKQWHETLELRPDQAQRDKGKYQEFTRQGYTILVLPESKIKSGEARKELEAILATM